MRVTSNFASGAWGFIAHLVVALHMFTVRAQIDLYTIKQMTVGALYLFVREPVFDFLAKPET